MIRPWNSSFSHDDRERWVCIYPIYLNSKRTLAEGRKMPIKYCVDNPKYDEIRDVLLEAGLEVGVEDKIHPKVQDSKESKSKGRIRVHLKNADGTPIIDHFGSRKAVLKYLGTTIPKLKSRQSSSLQTSNNDNTGKGKNKKKRK